MLAELRGKADHVLVDFHAEATSEKVAMGWHLDGRVTACVGTHTHVPTADARVLPGGTAYISDVGMTGPRGGVIGVKREQALERFRTHDAGEVRDLRRGPVAQRGAGRGARRRAGASRSSSCCCRRLSAAGSSASAITSSARRAARRPRAGTARAPPGRSSATGNSTRVRSGRGGHRRGQRVQPPGERQGAERDVQTRNCGESTLPRAAKAATAAREASSSRARLGPRRARPA